MKIDFSSRKLFACGLGLILVVNTIVLTGVLYNRSGDPEARIVLTERELKIVGGNHRENSGMHLQLQWRVFSENEDRGYGRYNSPQWFTPDKLEELGFDVLRYQRQWDNGRSGRPLPKKVYLVLEQNSPRHDSVLEYAQAAVDKAGLALAKDPLNKEFINRLRQTEEQLVREREQMSRLFAVDAGVHAGSLRDRYGDRERYVVIPAIVRMGYYSENTVKKPRGYIEKLAVETIHVPLQWRAYFTAKGEGSSRKTSSPGYHVTVAYGKKYQPWLIAVNDREKSPRTN